MNCNLDGTPLSEADLIGIALEAGATEEKLSGIFSCHNDNMIFSHLKDLTRSARHALFMAGQLRLRTEARETPPAPKIIVDPEMYAFLGLKLPEE